MVPFQRICPKLALPEERSIRLEGSGVGSALPNDDYDLVESYCQERNCDCRRVILTVVSRNKNNVEATISFGFDPQAPMRGPFLDPLNRQGKYARELLNLVTELLQRDHDYVARLERHYQIAKDIQNGKLRADDAAPSFRLPAPRPVPLTIAASGNDRTPRKGTVQPNASFNFEQDLGEEYDEERAREYIDALVQEFESSPEAQSLIEQDVSIGWGATIMRYSLMHLGLRPHEMSLADHDEVLFSLIPRKVATSPESAEEIVTELRAFWQFLQRQYGLRNAASILKELGPGAVERLRDELDNPDNFGLAKSFFRTGQLAGFDMSTPDGLAKFALIYNLQQAALNGKAQREDRGQQAPTSLGGRSPIIDIGFPPGFGMRGDSSSREGRQSARDSKKRQRQAKKRNRR